MGNDASKFGDYSTLANLTQNLSLAAPTGFAARYTGVGSVTLSWSTPSDYTTNPENYLGFFILKNFQGYNSSAAPLAPTKYGDPLTPYAIPVFVGKTSQMGDQTGLANTFEQSFSDINTGAGQQFAYSIFLMKSDLTYSLAASLNATVPGSAGETLLIQETFAGATIVNSDEIKTGMTNGKGLDFFTNQPTLTSISTTGAIAGSQAIKLTGSTSLSTTITSDNIPLNGVVFEPNTLYQLRFWTRSTFNPAIYTGDPAKIDNAANALSGILILDTPNWNVLQQYQVIHQEDQPDGTVCTTNLSQRVAAYDFGGSPPTYQYLGAAYNGVWIQHGVAFLTGATSVNLPSTPNNLFGVAGDPTQKFITDGPNGVLQNLRLTFTLSSIDKSVWGTDASSISAELGWMVISKGVYIPEPQYIKMLATTPLNFLLNPNFTFDTTTTAVVAPGTTPGYPQPAYLCSAASNWIINTGLFGYNPSLNLTYAVLKSTCTQGTTAGQDATLSQDIWYLSLIAGQTYELSFDVATNPMNVQEQICTGQGKYVCTNTGAVSALSIEIDGSAKSGVGTFTTVSINGGEAVPTSLAENAPALLTATEVNTQNPSATFNEAPSCTASDPLIGGWVTVKYTYQAPSLATAYKNLSPSIKFTMAKDTVGITPYWAIKNIKLAPQASDIAAGRIAIPGFDMPYPIPTVPSSVSGTTPSHVQTWDFTTMNLNDPVMEQLVSLNGAAVGPSSPNPVGGLYVLSQKQSDFNNLSVVTDTISPVPGGKVLCTTCYSGSNASTIGGAVLVTSEYFSSGVFDCYVKVANVLKDGQQVASNQPVGFTFADWVYSYQDYIGTYDGRELLSFGYDRNPEIDIEIGGNCPKGKDNTNYLYSNGRLNTWGGVLGGSGGQLENHQVMPSGFNLSVAPSTNNGYHKLTIVLNAGTDFASPANNGTTRSPGYIKWYVNDQLWGGGWLGANYGTDNIPRTAMRFTVGPWAPVGWAGDLFEADGTTYIWDTADFYMTKMEYTPLYNNGATDQSNYMIPPAFGAPTVVPFANRDIYLPESNPYNHYDPSD